MGMKGSAITKIYIQNGAMILIEVPRVLSLSSCLWNRNWKVIWQPATFLRLSVNMKASTTLLKIRLQAFFVLQEKKSISEELFPSLASI